MIVEGNVVEIILENEQDPNFTITCCDQTVGQQLTEYPFNINREDFLVRRVWANVCDRCNKTYLPPEMGAKISKIIFDRQHPRESQLARLLGEE